MSAAAGTALAGRYGPWAFVAGASEGIGAAFARQIADAGIHLVLAARRAEPLEALAGEIRASRAVQVRTVALDLTEGDLVARLAPATDDVEIGLLVYNAGAAHGATRFHDGPVERALQLVRLNCVGPVVLCHHFGGRMLARGRGGIIQLTSVSSVAGAARTATYCASKAFDLVFAEGLWAELRPRGVDVLALVAGATRTPAMERSGARIGDDFRGMEAEDVAREGLAHLGEGPTHVAGEFNRAAFEGLRKAPRADAVKALSAGARAVFGLPDEP